MLVNLNLKKHKTTDAEIIEHYKRGMSQKDIISIYSVSTERTRKVLKKAGFMTQSFRATDEDIKDYIIELINSGSTYSEIETKCDISFHTVREIVENNDLRGVSKRARLQRSKKPFEYLFLQEYEKFLKDYRNGYPFMYLCKKNSYSKKQVVYVFNLIFEKDIKTHRKKLKKKICNLSLSGLSAASIASQLDMSASIVRKVLA